MNAASRRIANRIADLRMPVESRRAQALLLAAAIAIFFSIGWLTRSARQTASAPWAPARAVPDVTVHAGESASPPIAELRPAPPVPPAKHHASAARFSAGNSPTHGRHAAAVEAQAPASTSQPASSATPPGSSSAPSAPTSSEGSTGSTSPGSGSSAPSSSRAGAGQGSSSGSFDSSG